MWKGIIIEESLDDATLLAMTHIVETRESPLEGQPGAALHLHKVVVSDEQKHAFVAAAARVIKHGPWYLHLCRDDRMVVVYNDHIFEFSEREKLKLESAQKYGAVVGVPAAQLDFGYLIRHPHG
jgi:hypothetical protein